METVKLFYNKPVLLVITQQSNFLSCDLQNLIALMSLLMTITSFVNYPVVLQVKIIQQAGFQNHKMCFS